MLLSLPKPGPQLTHFPPFENHHHQNQPNAANGIGGTVHGTSKVVCPTVAVFMPLMVVREQNGETRLTLSHSVSPSLPNSIVGAKKASLFLFRLCNCYIFGETVVALSKGAATTTLCGYNERRYDRVCCHFAGFSVFVLKVTFSSFIFVFPRIKIIA